MTSVLLTMAILAQTKPVAAYTFTSLDHVRQIAIATIIYATDNERFPSALSLKAALKPYVPDVDALLAAPGARKGDVSYFLDPRLSGKKLSAVPHPDRTALILAGKDGIVAFKGGKTPLGFADGHGVWAERTTVTKARTTPLK